MYIIHYTVHSIQRALCIYGVHNTARKIDEVFLGWTKEETIAALLRKGGLRGNITQTLKDSIKLVRYRCEKVAMSFDVSIASSKAITVLTL